jgi:hypothetical protein
MAGVFNVNISPSVSTYGAEIENGHIAPEQNVVYVLNPSFFASEQKTDNSFVWKKMVEKLPTLTELARTTSRLKRSNNSTAHYAAVRNHAATSRPGNDQGNQSETGTLHHQ